MCLLLRRGKTFASAQIPLDEIMFLLSENPHLLLRAQGLLEGVTNSLGNSYLFEYELRQLGLLGLSQLGFALENGFGSLEVDYLLQHL